MVTVTTSSDPKPFGSFYVVLFEQIPAKQSAQHQEENKKYIANRKQRAEAVLYLCLYFTVNISKTVLQVNMADNDDENDQGGEQEEEEEEVWIDSLVAIHWNLLLLL